MYELKPALKDKSFNSIQKILYCILKKNNITIRKASHIGQSLPDNLYNKIYDFINKIIKKRKKLDIKDNQDKFKQNNK